MASEGSVAVAKPAEDERCEDVIPMGAPIDVPEGVSRAEIHSTGRTTIFVEWTAGRVTVVPKLFSAQVDVVVPLPPGDAPGEFTLRCGVAESRK